MHSENRLRSVVTTSVALATLALAAFARPVFAQGEIDVTYRSRTSGGLATESFGTQSNGSGPNLAQGDIWTLYSSNASPETGNAIIVTPVVDPILDLTTHLFNDSPTTWDEMHFTLPTLPGVGFIPLLSVGSGIPTDGGRFTGIEFLNPNGILADDGSGFSQTLYSEIRFFDPTPTGILHGEENTFRWFAVFPDPPASGPLSYNAGVVPQVVTRIPEPGTLALALCMILPVAGRRFTVRLRQQRG